MINSIMAGWIGLFFITFGDFQRKKFFLRSYRIMGLFLLTVYAWSISSWIFVITNIIGIFVNLWRIISL